MIIGQAKAVFDANATAAGMILVPTANADLYSAAVNPVGGAPTCRVYALTMKGIAYLVTNGMVPDVVDAVMLLANIQAAATGKTTGWTQT